LTPPVLLAYAQDGPLLVLTIIVLAVISNSLSENIVAPNGDAERPVDLAHDRFLSFIFWIFILGAAGAFLAMPLTVALILFMNSFEETRGLAAIMGTTPT